MKIRLIALLLSFVLAPAALCQEQTVPSETAAVVEEEVLNYTVNWPSGLSLGEGQMTTRRLRPPDGAGERLEFTFKLEAAVPGFHVKDEYQSAATPAYCSLQLLKNATHGKKRVHEKTTFDLVRGLAERTTLGGGGRSEFAIQPCVKDGLTFLHFVRRELGQGRLPPAQTVYFGAPYQIRIRYLGTLRVRDAETDTEADRLSVSVKGPASENTFEILFAREEARTPVLVRVPLAMGSFSMELVR